MTSNAFMPNLNATINNGTVLGTLSVAGTGPSSGISQNRAYSFWTCTTTTNIANGVNFQMFYTSQSTGIYTNYLSVTGYIGSTGGGTTGTYFVNTSSGPQFWICSANAVITNTNSVPTMKAFVKVTQNGNSNIGFPVYIPTGNNGSISTTQALVAQPGDLIGAIVFTSGGTGAQITSGNFSVMQV